MKTAAIIFSGIYNDGLDYLTRNRTVASLPFAGRYRQIDFILSDMVNSGIYDIGVITKYNYQSLINHLGSCQDWDLNRKRGGLMLIPPFASGDSGGYRGKIEELRAALPFLEQKNADYVIPSELVIDSADGCTPDGIYLNYAARKGQYSALGMYVIRRDALIEAVTALSAKGFYHLERDFIQQGFNRGTLTIGMYRFDSLVLKNRTILEYYGNSLMMKDENVRNAIFRPDAPVYTTVRDEVPTFYGADSSVSDCLLADGCRIEGKVENSVLFRGVVIGKNAVVRNSIIMAGSVIHDGAVVENAIIDKEAQVSGLRRITGAPMSPMIIRKGEVV